MNWFLIALKKYSDFSGRAQRSEYWFFTLFYILIYIGIAIVDGVLGTKMILTLLFILAMFLPSITVAVRRLHDTDRSGWWILIGLIPLIGTIIYLVFLIKDSQPGPNRFGPNPKGI